VNIWIVAKNKFGDLFLKKRFPKKWKKMPKFETHKIK
jgi:hypothetical protein